MKEDEKCKLGVMADRNNEEMYYLFIVKQLNQF